jgi:hypothetical protein
MAKQKKARSIAWRVRRGVIVVSDRTLTLKALGFHRWRLAKEGR